MRKGRASSIGCLPPSLDDGVGYGVKDGKLVFIRDVDRGLSCGCACVRCGERLIAKKGSKRHHHFAHYELTNCHGAAESVLHRLAKELLGELKEIALPRYEFAIERKAKFGAVAQRQAVVAKGGIARINAVRIEKAEADFVPDIVIESRGRSLIVEVAVTHRVTRAKLRRIRRRNLPAIEIRLDADDTFIPRESLRAKLQHDSASKIWLFHPDQRKEERVFFSELRSRRRAIRRAMRPPEPSSGVAITAPGLGLSALGTMDKYDRTQEEFRIRHGRYPTDEECVQLWPHLWRQRTKNRGQTP